MVFTVILLYLPKKGYNDSKLIQLGQLLLVNGIRIFLHLVAEMKGFTFCILITSLQKINWYNLFKDSRNKKFMFNNFSVKTWNMTM